LTIACTFALGDAPAMPRERSENSAVRGLASAVLGSSVEISTVLKPLRVPAFGLLGIHLQSFEHRIVCPESVSSLRGSALSDEAGFIPTPVNPAGFATGLEYRPLEPT